MTSLPIVELRIQDMGEAIRAAVMLHHHEVEGYIQAGVDRAIRNIAEQMIHIATTEAEQCITEEIKKYFVYGAGGKAIKAAVERALEPITRALQQDDEELP